MGFVWGIAIAALGLLAWAGQALSWFAPDAAAKLKVADREDAVEPVYWADSRGEALWDGLTLWTLVVAGVLLVLEHAAWPYFGAIGGSTYLYFAGRGILTRIEMIRRGFRLGDPAGVRLALVVLGVWGVAGLITIIVSVDALAGS